MTITCISGFFVLQKSPTDIGLFSQQCFFLEMSHELYIWISHWVRLMTIIWISGFFPFAKEPYRYRALFATVCFLWKRVTNLTYGCNWWLSYGLVGFCVLHKSPINIGLFLQRCVRYSLLRCPGDFIGLLGVGTYTCIFKWSMLYVNVSRTLYFTWKCYEFHTCIRILCIYIRWGSLSYGLVCVL